MHRFAALLLSGFILAGSLHAQPSQITTGNETFVSFDWMKPVIKESDGVSFLTSAAVLAGRVRLDSKFSITAALRVTNFDVEGSEGSLDIGNPYVGLVYRRSDHDLQVELGAYFPAISEDSESSFVGTFSDLDRFEAYRHQTFAPASVITYTYRHVSGLLLQVRGGPSMLIHTGTEPAATDLVAHYGLQAAYEYRRMVAGMAITGVGFVTDSHLRFEEWTIHQGTIFVAADLADVRPSVFFRLPIDEDFGDSVRGVVGLGVAVPIR